MKKIIFIFSMILIVAAISFLLFFGKDEEVYEDIFSVRTSYSYINNNGVSFSVKLYSNQKKSLLAYPNEGEVYLHDKDDNNMIKCTVNNSYINETVLYNEEYYYEYIYDLSVNISTLDLDECYLKVKFSNKEYDFMIGSFEVLEKNVEDNIISVSNLYGLTSDDNNKSLCGIVLTLNNNGSQSVMVDEVYIGSNYKIFINKNNETACNESNNIYDYLPNYNRKNEIENTGILIKPNEKTTLVLPIKYQKDYYLYNTYLILKIKSKLYYYPNFTYIDSADLNTMDKYVIRGFVYDI